MLGSGEMAAREHPDVDAERREPLSRGDNLPRFERVLRAARDGEGNAVGKLAHKRRQIPSRGIATMLVNEPRTAMEEDGAVAAGRAVSAVRGCGHRKWVGHRIK